MEGTYNRFIFVSWSFFKSDEQPRALWSGTRKKVRWRFSSLTLGWMGPKGVVSTTALSTTIVMKADAGQIVGEIYWSKRKIILVMTLCFGVRKTNLGEFWKEFINRSQTIVSLFVVGPKVESLSEVERSHIVYSQNTNLVSIWCALSANPPHMLLSIWMAELCGADNP